MLNVLEELYVGRLLDLTLNRGNPTTVVNIRLCRKGSQTNIGMSSMNLHTNESSKINCVINFFGPSAFLEMSKFPSRIDHDAANSPESQLIGGALQSNKKKALQASPIYYASKDDVPFLHIHGTNDQLVPYNQSVIFNKKLLEKGCSSSLITIKGGGHGGFKDEKINRKFSYIQSSFSGNGLS